MRTKYNFTVQELRQKHYKVRVLHNVEEKTTEVQVTNPSGHNVGAIAKCGHNDQFSKKRGVKIALNRAMKQLEKSKYLDANNLKDAKDLRDVQKDIDKSIDTITDLLNALDVIDFLNNLKKSK
jgi:hypothetical protein